jgi:hypothetical protein
MLHLGVAHNLLSGIKIISYTLVQNRLCSPTSSNYNHPRERRVNFTEENIAALFGHEAAEDEDIERLKSYYLKGSI